MIRQISTGKEIKKIVLKVNNIYILTMLNQYVEIEKSEALWAIHNSKKYEIYTHMDELRIVNIIKE